MQGISFFTFTIKKDGNEERYYSPGVPDEVYKHS
jgi:hypothetical protein